MNSLNRAKVELSEDLRGIPDFANILIVDDQRFDRRRLERLCNGLEFETRILEADRLETMGTMLQLHQFNLILLDYNLPDGNGLQALDAIRLDPKNRQTAIIMVAGGDQAEVAIEAMKRGCSDYITKDDLSADSFRRAAINALQKSSLTIGAETQELKRKQMEAVLQKFSAECAQEIKPVLTRMMRQLRDFRDVASVSPEQAAEKFARIENSCMRLWDFLDELDAYSGADLAQEAFPGRSLLEADPEVGATAARVSPGTNVRPRNAGAAAVAPARPETTIRPKRPVALFRRDKQ